jgi:hypothetical protein
LSPSQDDGNLCRVPKTRLKSSFIYLANAVNDLRGNWAVLAIVIAPLALAVALWLLPDALRLQHRLVQTFQNAGGQAVSFIPAQAGRPEGAQPESPLHTAFLILINIDPVLVLTTLILNLVVLCALQRMQAKVREPTVIGEAIAVYRRAIQLAPAFGLIVLLQWLVTAVGAILLMVPALLVYVWLYFAQLSVVVVLLIMAGLPVYLWLYFAQYSLVFDNRHSWPALLFSRELMRKRFFKVATRIVVFLVVGWGYNSLVTAVVLGVSLLLGPVSIVTNSIATTIFLVDLVWVAVSYATFAFFIAAGARLYQDLCAIAHEETPQQVPAMRGTVPLTTTAAPTA